MYAAQITRIVRSDPLMNSRFGGIFCKNLLPSHSLVKGYTPKRTVFIVNTDNCDSIGEHWVLASFPDNKRLLWFDPFAKKPAHYGHEFALWARKYRLIPLLRKPVQHPGSVYCGLYTLYFFYHTVRNIPPARILEIFTRRPVALRDNDATLVRFFRSRFNFDPRSRISPRWETINTIRSLDFLKQSKWNGI